MYTIIDDKDNIWEGHIFINNKKYDVDKSIIKVPVIECDLHELDDCIKYKYFPKEVGFRINVSSVMSNILLYKENDKILLWTCYEPHSYPWEEKWSLYHFTSNLFIKLEENNMYMGKFTLINDDDVFLDVEICIKDNIPFQSEVENCINYLENVYYEVYEEMIRENNFYNISLPLSKIMHTAFKQYLLYFVDFVYMSKGKQINVKVESTNKSIELKLEKNIEYEEVFLYLQEYLNFIRTNINSLNPTIKNNLSNIEKDILMVDLKNQINHLKSSLEIKSIEIKYLNESVSRLNKLLLEEKRNPKPNIIHFNNKVAATSNTKVNCSIKNDLGKFINDFYNLKEILSNINENTKHELNKIDDVLVSIDEKDSKSIRENKGTFKRFKRILNQINSPGSILNQTIKSSQNAVDIAKKLATTYNTIAKYLGLEKIIDFLK